MNFPCFKGLQQNSEEATLELFKLITEVLTARKEDGKTVMLAVIEGTGATTASGRRKWKK